MLSYYYHHSKYPITTSASNTHISVATIKNFSSNLSIENDSTEVKSVSSNDTNLCKLCNNLFIYLIN